MEQYVYKRRADGVHIVNLRKTWGKLLLAASAIVAIEYPSEVFVISSRPYGQRAVLKFAAHTGATPIAGRFTPSAFTNQIQAAFREPRLLIVTDPAFDHQPITEASYLNIPVIALCNTDSPLRFVDCIGLVWWILAREVLRLRGTIPRDTKWDIVVDLFFYREPEEAEKKNQAGKEAVAAVVEIPAPIDTQDLDWNTAETTDWAPEAAVVPPAAPIAGVAPAFAVATDDWATELAQERWTNQPQQAAAPNWGGSSDWA
nr:unnamed protein product [Callosobruchus chinensis]